MLRKAAPGRYSFRIAVQGCLLFENEEPYTVTGEDDQITIDLQPGHQVVIPKGIAPDRLSLVRLQPEGIWSEVRDWNHLPTGKYMVVIWNDHKGEKEIEFEIKEDSPEKIFLDFTRP